MAKLLPNSVQHGESTPQDKSRPSFLGLPRELQIMILEAMFLVPGGIILRGNEKNRPPRNYFSLWDVPPHYHGSASLIQVRTFSQILLNCRQLYSDVIRILYSDNHFYFSYQQPRPEDGIDMFPWCTETLAASMWLDSIGRNMQFLRHFTVLFSRTGPVRDHIDVTKLLVFKGCHERLVVETNTENDPCGHKFCTPPICFRNNMTIGFGYRNHAGEPLPNMESLREGVSDIDAWLVSHAFDDLVYEKPMSASCRFPDLFYRVCLPANTRARGYIEYKPYNHCIGVADPHDAEITATDGHTKIEKKYHAKLTRLPGSIIKQIFQILHQLPANTRPRTEIQINADPETWARQPRLDVNLIKVSRSLSDLAINDFYHRVCFTVRGSSSTTRASIPDANRLINFMLQRFKYAMDPTTIHINYKLNTASGPKGLLVNIRPLVLFYIRCLQTGKRFEKSKNPLFVEASCQLLSHPRPFAKTIRIRWSTVHHEARFWLREKAHLPLLCKIARLHKIRDESPQVRKILDGPCPDIWMSFETRHPDVEQVTSHQPTDNDGGLGFVSWGEVLESIITHDLSLYD
ncbi:hypothetical protein P154DRAFT_615367 [Amniculicola lignicola CBS 123094]|uniref:F-box domain-containing protein n=1 Tax=Amniculicola lignicola CBS 123094 TaxID=1392246 RepID=A0A6A5WXW2_9PLEO|nr:hypothetical protein P154DRAFT_615367 [Amniculicola lignicola CBS 123094]